MRELFSTHTTGLGDNSRQEMGTTRAIEHSSSGRRHQRLIERELYPIITENPLAIVSIARRLQAGLHREQILYGDLLLLDVITPGD